MRGCSGRCMVLFGGMRGFIRGACVVLFGGCAWFYLGGAWFYSGACMVLFGSMRGFIRGHVWFYLGGCMVLFGGHAWFYSGACVVLFGGGGMRGFFSFFGYNEIRSISGRYASYWNAFFFLDKMASYHLDLGDSRISKLYSRQDVQIQFMAKKWSSKLSDLGRVKDMSDLLLHLERMRNQRSGVVISRSKSLDGRPGMRNVGLHWFDFTF